MNVNVQGNDKDTYGDVDELWNAVLFVGRESVNIVNDAVNSLNVDNSAVGEVGGNIVEAKDGNDGVAILELEEKDLESFTVGNKENSEGEGLKSAVGNVDSSVVEEVAGNIIVANDGPDNVAILELQEKDLESFTVGKGVSIELDESAENLEKSIVVYVEKKCESQIQELPYEGATTEEKDDKEVGRPKPEAIT